MKKILILLTSLSLNACLGMPDNVSPVEGFVGMLSAGVLVPEAAMSETAEVVLTVLGGATLITAHLRNAYFCQLCRACGREPCTGELTDTVRV